MTIGSRLGHFGRRPLTSLAPGTTYRTEPNGPLLEVVSHGPEKSYVRPYESDDPIGSSVNTNISPTHPSIYVLVVDETD